MRGFLSTGAYQSNDPPLPRPQDLMNLIRYCIGSNLYDKLEKYRPTEAQMPWAYQIANPKGRPLHNDWALMKSTPRIETARRSPYPQRIKKGAKVQNWYPLDPTYPLSPGAVIEVRDYWVEGKTYKLPHILIDDAVDGGGWTEFEAWIDGEWVPACKRFSKVIGGRMFKHYQGYKCDTTVDVKANGDTYTLVSDVMGWIEFPTFSWNKV